MFIVKKIRQVNEEISIKNEAMSRQKNFAMGAAFSSSSKVNSACSSYHVQVALANLVLAIEASNICYVRPIECTTH